MSASSEPEIVSGYTDMPDVYVIVKFRADADEASLRRLFEGRVSTNMPSPPDLPEVLDWPAIFQAAQGENSVSFGPLATELTYDELKDLDQQGRDFRQRLIEADEDFDPSGEVDRDGNPLRPSEEDDYIPPELETFFRFDLDSRGDRSDDEVIEFFEQLIEIVLQSDTVELAYIASEPAIPPHSRTASLYSTLTSYPQGYFGPRAQGGIGIAAFLIAHPQAHGELVRVVDVEQGWYGEHNDLPPLQYAAPISGDNIALVTNYPSPANPDPVYSHNVGLHGLMTLGLLVAKHDSQGVNGIAPNIPSLQVASEWKFDSVRQKYIGNTYNALLAATSALRHGDVLLLEGQQKPLTISVGGSSQSNKQVPMEIRPDLFNAIIAATQKGVTVIQPAGNNLPNGISLDNVTLTIGGIVYPLFNKDSGAVLVAAGRNAENLPDFDRAVTTNFGTYINCFADGDWLWVLDPPAINSPVSPLTPQQLADLFVEIESGGTSSAAAIVAGVAILLQSLARQIGRIVPPKTMRTILADKVLNKPSKTPATDKIGVMPDLDAIILKYGDLKKVSIPA